MNENSQDGLHNVLQALAQELIRRGWMMTTAESCTGGLIAAACTELPGSSRWFDRGFVTYSNAAKTEMLGVPEDLIEKHGAVSEEVARAMVEGAVCRPAVQVAVAVTGVAGPDGGSTHKPVGTVWIAWHVDGEVATQKCLFDGDRAAVRGATVVQAMQEMLAKVSRITPSIH